MLPFVFLNIRSKASTSIYRFCAHTFPFQAKESGLQTLVMLDDQGGKKDCFNFEKSIRGNARKEKICRNQFFNGTGDIHSDEHEVK